MLEVQSWKLRTFNKRRCGLSFTCEIWKILLLCQCSVTSTFMFGIVEHTVVLMSDTKVWCGDVYSLMTAKYFSRRSLWCHNTSTVVFRLILFPLTSIATMYNAFFQDVFPFYIYVFNLVNFKDVSFNSKLYAFASFIRTTAQPSPGNFWLHPLYWQESKGKCKGKVVPLLSHKVHHAFSSGLHSCVLGPYIFYFFFLRLMFHFSYSCEVKDKRKISTLKWPSRAYIRNV